MTRPTITRSKFPMLPFEQSLLEKYGGVGWLLNDVVGNSYCNVINTAVPVGRNLVIDPGFDDAAKWTAQTNWSVGSGVASAAAVTTAQFIFPVTSILQVGRAYTVTYTVVVTSGSINFQCGTTGILSTPRSASGTYSETLLCIGNVTLRFTAASGTFTGTIDNVSCVELNIPAYNATPIQILNADVWNGAGIGAWTAGNSATISQQTVTRHDGASGTVLRIARNGVTTPSARQAVLTVGKVYRCFGWAHSDGSAIPRIQNNAALTTYFTGTASTDWQLFDFVFVADATAVLFQASTNTGTQFVEFDVTVVALDTGMRTDSIGLDMNMEALADSGTASAGALATLTDSAKTWTTNQHVNRLVSIISGTGAGQTRTVTSNTATQLSVNSSWTSNPDNTSVYQIISYWVVGNSGFVSKNSSATHSGTYNIRVARVTTNSPFVSQVILVPGKTYRITGWFRGDGSGVGTARVGLGTSSNVANSTNSNAWQSFDAVGIATNSSVLLQLIATSGTGYAEFDDVTVTELSPLVGVPVNSPTLGNTEVSRLLKSISFDKVNNLVNLYSAQLNSILNPTELTFILFGQVDVVGEWTDATARTLGRIQVDINNRFIFQKTSTNATLQGVHIAGATSLIVSSTAIGGSTAWFCLALTVSVAADQVKFYINGTQVGSTLTGLGIFVGNILSTSAVIASSSTTAANVWGGRLTHCFLLDAAASASEIAEWASLGDVS